MALKLKTASKAQQDAAFEAIYPEIETLVETYVPPFFQYQVLEKLHSDEGRAMLIKLVDDGLNAAENAA